MTLPYDIIVDIVSRLPLKLIIGCKILSKTINDLISRPSFSQIYLTNNSNSFCTLGYSYNDDSLVLDEFDLQGNHESVQKFNTKRRPGGYSSSICGYCNGLICLLRVELGIYYKSFVINPILSEFIQLPEQVDSDNEKTTMFSYGLGHCELSNRYKVLKVTEVKHGDRTWKANTEIFTIGYDQIWRSASDIDFLYNVRWGRWGTSPQCTMVPLRSALHWLMYPVSSFMNVKICAFNMAEEKASVLQLPPQLAFSPCGFYSLNVSLDKLCLAEILFPVADFWVMDEYGVEGSWTKKFVINITTLPEAIYRNWSLLTESPGGVILISDGYKFVFFDMKKEICLREIHRANHSFDSIPFVPNFVSLINLVQPSASMTNVPPCSLGSEVASAPLDDQLQ